MTETENNNKQSLSNLTESFIQLLKSYNGAEVELSVAESILGANKRRLYDVTNVLSGIGMIERCGKSKIKWVEQKSTINNENIHSYLFDKEKELEDIISNVDNSINELSKSEIFNDYGWITPEDILKVVEGTDLKIFALKGPPSMTIQISETDDNVNHQMICESEDDPITLTRVLLTKN